MVLLGVKLLLHHPAYSLTKRITWALLCLLTSLKSFSVCARRGLVAVIFSFSFFTVLSKPLPGNHFVLSCFFSIISGA